MQDLALAGLGVGDVRRQRTLDEWCQVARKYQENAIFSYGGEVKRRE